LDGIYLCYKNNHQGGNTIFHLQTNQIIVSRNITAIPITLSIINQVNCIATLKNMPTGLKISTQENQTFYNSTLIAGMDYHQDQEDTHKHNNNNHEEGDNRNYYNQDDTHKHNNDDHKENYNRNYYDKMNLDKIIELAQENFKTSLSTNASKIQEGHSYNEIIQKIEEQKKTKKQKNKKRQKSRRTKKTSRRTRRSRKRRR
jgi:hypothetical protein